MSIDPRYFRGPRRGMWELGDWPKKIRNFVDWATNKGGDGRFG